MERLNGKSVPLSQYFDANERRATAAFMFARGVAQLLSQKGIFCGTPQSPAQIALGCRPVARLKGRLDMRFLFEIIVGVGLTLGTAYVFDATRGGRRDLMAPRSGQWSIGTSSRPNSRLCRLQSIMDGTV